MEKFSVNQRKDAMSKGTRFYRIVSQETAKLPTSIDFQFPCSFD